MTRSSAVVVCPSPSFVPAEIPLLHRIGDVFTLNRALRAWQGMAVLPHAAFFLDLLCHFKAEMPLIRRPEIQKIARERYEKGWEGIENVRFIRFESTASPKLNPFTRKELTSPMLSTLVAWQVLARQGYRRIYMVGCEGRFDDKAYFCDWQGTPVEIERRRKRYRQVCNFLIRWNEYAKPLGIETVNLSATSRLKGHLRTITTEQAAEEEDTRGRD